MIKYPLYSPLFLRDKRCSFLGPRPRKHFRPTKLNQGGKSRTGEFIIMMPEVAVVKIQLITGWRKELVKEIYTGVSQNGWLSGDRPPPRSAGLSLASVRGLSPRCLPARPCCILLFPHYFLIRGSHQCLLFSHQAEFTSQKQCRVSNIYLTYSLAPLILQIYSIEQIIIEGNAKQQVKCIGS